MLAELIEEVERSDLLNPERGKITPAFLDSTYKRLWKIPSTRFLILFLHMEYGIDALNGFVLMATILTMGAEHIQKKDQMEALWFSMDDDFCCELADEFIQWNLSACSEAHRFIQRWPHFFNIVSHMGRNGGKTFMLGQMSVLEIVRRLTVRRN